jgi:hypothetical protein
MQIIFFISQLYRGLRNVRYENSGWLPTHKLHGTVENILHLKHVFF